MGEGGAAEMAARVAVWYRAVVRLHLASVLGVQQVAVREGEAAEMAVRVAAAWEGEVAAPLAVGRWWRGVAWRSVCWHWTEPGSSWLFARGGGDGSGFFTVGVSEIFLSTTTSTIVCVHRCMVVVRCDCFGAVRCGCFEVASRLRG